MVPVRSASLFVAATLSLLPVGSFTLDPGASRVEFVVKDNRGGFTGVARDVQASAVVTEQGEAFAAQVEARIDARSITTGVGVRDSQMRRDFLLTDRYPTIMFTGAAVPIDAVTGLTFRALVKGTLTLKDISREIEFPVRVIALRDSYLMDGKVTIRLTEFNIPIPRFLIFVAEDRMDVILRVRFVSRSQ